MSQSLCLCTGAPSTESLYGASDFDDGEGDLARGLICSSGRLDGLDSSARGLGLDARERLFGVCPDPTAAHPPHMLGRTQLRLLTLTLELIVDTANP